MITRLPIIGSTAIALLSATAAPLCADDQEAEITALRRQVNQLTQQNRTLKRSLVAANQSEQEASKHLKKLRQQLNALGADFFQENDNRLVQAVADIQVLSARISELEQRANALGAAVETYLTQAVASDPEARAQVERSIRELDEVLGLRQKPSSTNQNSGTSQRAVVLSIDSESGLLVFNRGTDQGVRIGTTYRLHRGDQAYGTAIIADVRQRVAGAFVESSESGHVRLGDTALLITE